MSDPLLVILGPTATGKTRLAALVADKIDGEIISADSRQVYRKMDLGTGKDYDDYIVNGKQVPHHLVDIHEPGYKYSVYEFQRDFIQSYKDVRDRGKVPVLCGGTGMYIDAVIRGYKLIEVPENKELRKELNQLDLEELVHKLSELKPLHNVTDSADRERAIRAIEIESYYRSDPAKERSILEINSCVTGILMPRELIRERITARLEKRLEEGMIDEVRNLIKDGVSVDDLAYYGLEYRYIAAFLEGSLSYEEMFRKLNTAIHGFAKRQMTWFRRMEKKGVMIHWVDGLLSEDKKAGIVEGIYKQHKKKTA